MILKDHGFKCYSIEKISNNDSSVMVLIEDKHHHMVGLMHYLF